MLDDFFKSKAQREKELRVKQRKAKRDAETAIDTVKDRANKLKADRDKAWKEARQYLKDGQKAASQRSLQSCRACEMLMTKLEMKRWVFEQLITKMELSQTDQDFTNALHALNAVIKIDPERVEDVLGEVEDKLGEQVDVDKIWERVYGKEMAGVETKMTDVIPSIEEMEQQLQDEVAEDIGDRKGTRKASEKEDPGLAEKIGEGRARLRKLMEDDK